jgi:predicted NAD-dependent protein-ADP-ribosyltransferase YbiA (DUF1768 family)
MSLEEQAQEEEIMDDFVTTPENGETRKFIINDNDPFLPHYLEDFQVNGVVYRSAVHYAYSVLFNTIENNMNVNSIPLSKLQEEYNEQKNIFFFNKLKRNNEEATIAKLTKFNVLRHLLQLTKKAELIYEDNLDPVLGVGEPMRENLVGRFLVHQRTLGKPAPLPLEFNSLSISDNILFKEWMANFIQEIKRNFEENKNVKNTTQNIAKMMNVALLGKNESVAPSSTDLEVLQKNGIRGENISTVYPVLLSAYQRMLKGNPVKTFVDLYSDYGPFGSMEEPQKSFSLQERTAPFSLDEPSLQESEILIEESSPDYGSQIPLLDYPNQPGIPSPQMQPSRRLNLLDYPNQPGIPSPQIQPIRV